MQRIEKNDTYSKIWDSYQDHVLAFQHRTLTQSPLRNAVDLAKKLPNNGEFHIISHSRGGLIGDILCKYSENKGFSKDHIELLKKKTEKKILPIFRSLMKFLKLKKSALKNLFV
ncbi:DUF7379 domain-containing protein [Chryseobacterium balustinum]|uniref:DUF7379 domain-containing protein n=1 Tax=Chryseobacterium balustinum TaxID=246 RepID=UPI003BF553B8